MKLLKRILPFGFMALPFVAGAISDLEDIFDFADDVLSKLVPLLIAVAVVILLIAIVSYIRAGDDDEKRGKARNLMIYGIIGLFVMVSIWGLVNILSGTFDLDNDIPDTVDDLLPRF
ncbi:hypothetical protein C4572_03640 [Candidatus Parcubacteria bacterium]|nr:MAG: hypothetical protein C4572_03640 [Candidatus Parcubacteria bacterium]